MSEPEGSRAPASSSSGQTRLASSPSKPAGDETRLASARSTSASGWLSSSGAIDHGRFEPGTLLGGRYRIVGRLGKGGMGEVFRADDLKLGQPVALKFLPPDVDRDPARLTQLHTEVRMARQVSHPNVCRVYDIDEVDGHTFLSMEYVDGEDLASLLRRIGRFPEERAIEIARQICAGLAAAHERGVVHRDFKPANVMLDGGGQVRIADFGLAGLSGESIRAGTPAYMAPEQLAGGDVTIRSDIYALGLVLYEIFTGQRALDGKNLADLIRRREQAEIVPPSALVRGLSPEIDRTVMRCLAPAPDARPASALIVSAALPGGDPLAAALAAGETPSPEMVAAAGEGGGLSRTAGMSLLAVVVFGLIGVAVLSDRVLLLNRVPFEKSADVLEHDAREILARTGYSATAPYTARGVGLTTEQLPYLAPADLAARRWEFLQTGNASVLRFWYRTSPRDLAPVSPQWNPTVTDPPLVVSGMATVAVDQRGRLVELVAVPPQMETSTAPATPVDWRLAFDLAGLPFAEFSPVEPQWTPRIYAGQRHAWEGPLPDAPAVKVRVEAAEYRGRPVSFQIVGPWTRPVRMEQPTPNSGSRALAIAGTVLLLTMMGGAVALVRDNIKRDRADRAGASRIALFLMGVWAASWALGARHSLSLDAEVGRFFMFLAPAVLNTSVTWLFYVALEPLVRRFFPDILISWTRLVRGQFRDPRVGRDVLIGLAVGVSLVLSRFVLVVGPSLLGDPPDAPQASSVQYFLGARFALSGLLQVLPNALQAAMLATFAFVMLRVLVRRNWLAAAIASALFAAVIIVEAGGDRLAVTLLFVTIIVVPMMFIFLRFGLLSLATALVVIQASNRVPLTSDLTAPHGAIAAWSILACCALAAYAFHVSRAGRGLFRGVV